MIIPAVNDNHIKKTTGAVERYILKLFIICIPPFLNLIISIYLFNTRLI